ncbi:MAG: chorismate mutase [Coriobacteriia bacterium]|nr:chorismate mutase [Coriobacteriia bacterium]
MPSATDGLTPALKKQLDDIRGSIDQLDDQIRELFLARLQLVQDIADFKRQNDLQILQAQREREILARLTADLTFEQAAQVTALYCEIFDISRTAQ